LDELLLERRRREFAVFKQIEQKQVQARLEDRFESVEQFVTYANSVTNRRKSRAGTSLELNLEETFRDEGLVFESQALTEDRKRPDFLFPSARAYHNSEFPEKQLRMLAAKTCCRDRWRQVVNEAKKIRTKHLFTLQEGVSSNQLREMRGERVVLVVPKPHLKSFPIEERSAIMTLDGFVQQVKQRQAGIDLSRWII
jgi:type II restriction enzyme